MKNMKKWLSDCVGSAYKRPLPILTFPSVKALGIKVCDLVKNSDLQAKGMAYVCEHTNTAAAVSFMDLSVEAEAFGAAVRFSEDEVPTVTGRLINSEEDAEALRVPAIGDARTGVYVEAIEKAGHLITDRPVLAGMIGPFSLAARLFDVSEIMMDCYDDPDTVHAVLKKVTTFLKSYADAFKDAGADGVVIAEPVAGLLSPALEEEFSAPYVKEIVDSVKNDNFITIYHNCGASVVKTLDSIIGNGADAYHFGNAVDLCEILKKVPPNVPVLGNIDPAGQLRMGTPESVRAATLDLLEKASVYPNFLLSSGCDIPPQTPWENIAAFFGPAEKFYGNKK